METYYCRLFLSVCVCVWSNEKMGEITPQLHIICYQIKQLVPRIGHILFSCSPKGSYRHRTMQSVTFYKSAYIAEDATCISYQTWPNRANAQLNSLPLLSSVDSDGRYHIYYWKCNHQSHPAMNPVSYNSNLPEEYNN